MVGHTITLAVMLGAGAALWPAMSSAQEHGAQRPFEPPFGIWDVAIGEPVSQIPSREVVDLACGTNGGPPSLPLEDPETFETCPVEPSGLREVTFSYDDELEYIAKAVGTQYDVYNVGTTVYAHDVMVSALVDADGIVRGIRIITDPRVSERERRSAASLARNFKARYKSWDLECEDLPPTEGEEPVGSIFIKQTCTGRTPERDLRLRLDSRYLRKPGQRAVNPETQQVNSGYFESYTRLEVVEMPFEPAAYGER